MPDRIHHRILVNKLPWVRELDRLAKDLKSERQRSLELHREAVRLREMARRVKPGHVHACNDGWLCEAHPTLGSPHDHCRGPAVSCPVCQPKDGPPPMRSGSEDQD